MEMALSFNDVVFSPIEQQNNLWIRAAELAKALGYSREDQVSRIYHRNAEEFTPDMTQVIEIADNTDSVVSTNVSPKVRIFSLRGCHLLSMFARTPIAKAFRKWVLDVLDRIAKEESQPQANGPDTPIGPADQNVLQTIVRTKALALADASHKGGFPQIWSRFNDHFRLGSYKQLPQSKMADAVEYLVKLEVREKKELPQQQALPPSGDKYEAYMLEVETARGRISEEISRLMDKGIELVDYRKFGPGCLSPYTYALADWLRDVLTRSSPVVDGWRKADNTLNYSPVGIFQKMEKDFEFMKGK